MDCRGHNRRIQIVQNYDVIPEVHLPVMNGITIKSDAGNDISKTYFIFTCIPKTTGKKETIICGRTTANDFSKLTGKELPLLFNPLINAPLVGGINANAARLGNHNNHPHIKWNKARKQLYNATMLMILYTGNKPDPFQPLFGIRRDIEKYPNYSVQIRHVKALVTVLKKFKTTIPKVIDKLEVNNMMIAYNFDLLADFLISKNQNELVKFFVI